MNTVSDFIFIAQVAASNHIPVGVEVGRFCTEETFAAELAVGLGCSHFQLGSWFRSENLSKVNECLRIQDAYEVAHARITSRG